MSYEMKGGKKKKKGKGASAPHLDDSWPPNNVPEVYENGSNLSISEVIKKPALELNPVNKAKLSAQVPNAVINRFTGAVSDDEVMEKNIRDILNNAPVVLNEMLERIDPEKQLVKHPIDEAFIRNFYQEGLVTLLENIIKEYSDIGIEKVAEFLKGLEIDLEKQGDTIKIKADNGKLIELQGIGDLMVSIHKNVYSKKSEDINKMLYDLGVFIHRFNGVLHTTLSESKDVIIEKQEEIKPIAKDLIITMVSTIIQALVIALSMAGPFSAAFTVPYNLSKMTSNNVPVVTNLVNTIGSIVGSVDRIMSKVHGKVEKAAEPAVNVMSGLQDLDRMLTPYKSGKLSEEVQNIENASEKSIKLKKDSIRSNQTRSKKRTQQRLKNRSLKTNRDKMRGISMNIDENDVIGGMDF